MQISEQQKRKMLAAAELVDKGDLAVLAKIIEFQDFLEEFEEKFNTFTTEKGSDLDTFKEIKSGELSSLTEALETKITEIHEEVEKGMSEGKKMGEEQAEALKKVSESVSQFKESLSKRLEEVKGLIPEMPDSFDPTDILNRVNEIELKIPKIPDEITSYQVRDKLESIEDEKEKLKIEAISELRKELDELRKMAGASKGGGGTSALGVRQAFKYIFHTEALQGTIDGVNTDFTVSMPIWSVIAVTLNGEYVAQLPNFTVVGNKIVFSSAIPSAYSGKDFECKFIG
jgi:hypothetical protein